MDTDMHGKGPMSPSDPHVGHAVSAESVRGGQAGTLRRPAVHVAAVIGGGEVRFLTAAPTRASLMELLAGYVLQHADGMLRPDAVLELRRLISAGRTAEAVRFYFERVGERWEKEYLCCETILLPNPS
jgi:hypothetical protein